MKNPYSKKDIAKEQLVIAIRLFFCAECPVSVHTLTAASLGVLQDILRVKKKDYLLDIEKQIKPEKIKEWRALIRKQANFLKHADRDPEGSLRFSDTQTQFMLIEAVNAFATLYGKKTLSMMVYQIWFACAYPGFFTGHGWLSLKNDLEEMGFETGNFTKEAACFMLDVDKNDPELDNSA